MQNPQSKPKSPGRWKVIALSIAVAVVFMLFAAGMLINSMSLSPELREPPAETLEKFRIADTASAERNVRAEGENRLFVPPAGQDPPGPSWKIIQDGSSYREYVQWLLEQEPGLPGAEAYLRWSEALDLDDFLGKDLLHQKRDLWRECLAEGEPFPDDLEQWLLANQDYLEAIRRFAAEGAPGPSQDDIKAMNSEDMSRIPVPNFLDFQTSAKILRAEALRLLLAGDEAGCAEQFAASYRLARQIDDKPGLISELIAIALSSITTGGINSWISLRPVSPECLQTLLEELNYGMEDISPEGRMAKAFEGEYRISRHHLAKQLDAPWTNIFKENDYHNKTWGERIAQAPIDAFYSINAKVNAEKLLGIHDEMWAEMASDIARPFHEDKTFDKRIGEFISAGRGYGPYYSPMAYVPNHLEANTRSIVSKAKIATTRAAVHVLLLQQEAGAAPAVDFSNPIWRDPFGEQPLHLESGPNHTLIYSIGPDLKDQQGRTAYDPTNGTLSAGDIAIRVTASENLKSKTDN